LGNKKTERNWRQDQKLIHFGRGGRKLGVTGGRKGVEFKKRVFRGLTETLHIKRCT